MIFLRILTFIFILLSINQVFSQNNWQHFTSADGLVANSINKVLIQDASNIWLATDSGLSHFDGTNFTNYTIFNSALNNQNIKDIEYVQNTLWVLTDFGIASYNGTNFTVFSTVNGLLTNNITDIASTSNGDLWIASLNGVSKYDGTQFTHYSSKVARAIESDTNDMVYILTRTAVIDAAPITIYEVFDGNNWSSPPTGRFSGNYQVKFFKSRNGKIFFAGRNQARIAELTYPFNLNEINFTNFYANGISNPNMVVEKDNQIWISDSQDDFVIGALKDTILNPVIFKITGKRNVLASDMDSNDGIAIIGSDNGFYMASSLISPSNHEETMDVNQIRTRVNDTEPLFSSNPNATLNFEFPKNSGKHGVFSANVIVAAKLQGTNNVLVNPVNMYMRERNPGPMSNASALGKSYIVKVSRQEIDFHRANFNQSNYILPLGIKNWPANADSSAGMAVDLAPFIDRNRNDCYDPENGDYPYIQGDEAIYWINHPVNPLMPFEFHWMLYGFNSQNDTDINQTLFLQYKIINRSSLTYDSVKVGFFMDGDIGNPMDDYVGSDSTNHILYFYNGDLLDENTSGGVNGYLSNPPALGIKFLTDTMENAMTMGHTNIVGTGIPLNESQWWDILRNRWHGGFPLKYGGNGFAFLGVTNVNTTHIFSGRPFPQAGWIEANASFNQVPNLPGDRVGVATIPFFSLSAFESKTIEFAVGYDQLPLITSSIGQSVPGMIRVLNHAKAVWDTLPRFTPNYSYACFNIPVSLDKQQIENKTLKIFPNPSSGQVFIKSDNAIQALEVYNMDGQLLRSAIMQNQLNFSLDFSDLNNGLYLIRLQDAENKWQMRKVMMVK